VTVLGTGYLGATHAACMAELGFDVLGVDVDAARIGALAAGRLPFYEPGLEPLLVHGLESGRLRFSTSFQEAADFGDVHFCCVGTPQRAGSGGADLSQLFGCIDTLAPLLHRPCLIVGKSTTPTGTAAILADRLARLAPAGSGVELAWSPEFLREGHAVADTLRPERIVVGVRSASAEATLRELYADPRSAGVPFVVTDFATAELVKVAANAFLATKISFINAMAEVCEIAGADVTRLAAALAHDDRIGGKFLAAGLGFGGGCLPKDIRAFRATARELGVGSVEGLLGEVDAINMSRRSRVTDLAREAVGGTLAGQRVAVLGVAFKPGSDDVRDSPSLDVCDRLSREGALVSVHDPVAMKNAARIKPHLQYAETVTAAAAGADLVMHLTEWADYRAIDPVAFGSVVARRNIVDARCALDEKSWRAAGWSVRTLGRP
jgi:UDPglucose 6-dehydrogenase